MSDYGNELPAGFKLDAPAPQAKAAPAAKPAATDHGPDLPPGFKLDAPAARPSTSVKPPAPVPPQPSTGSFMLDQFKKGWGDLASMVPLASDIANKGVQHANPTSPTQLGLASSMLHLGEAGANKLRTLFGGKPVDYDSPQADSHLAEKAQGGMNQLLGVKDVPEPLNSTGGKSKANEYLGEFARFSGGGLAPDAMMAKAAERKLATFMVSTAGTGLAATSAVELKEIGGNVAHHFGLSKEQGQQVGEFLGGLAGPGMVGLGAQAAMRGKAMATAGMEKAGMPGLSKEAQQAAANQHVAGQITDSINSYPLGQQNMDRAAELSQQMPGFKPTVAQASDSPSLIAMHRQRASTSNESLNKATAVDEANAKAIQDFKDQKFPSQPKQVIQPGEEGLTKSEGLDAARDNHTFEFTPGQSGAYPQDFGKGTGWPQAKGTEPEKLFPNFATDIPKASPERQAKFRQDVFNRADQDPRAFTDDPVKTHTEPLPGNENGVSVTVEAAGAGNTRVRLHDAEGNVLAAAKLKNGMLDSVATHEDAQGQGLGKALLGYIDKQKIGNIHEVPDRSPWFVDAQRKVIADAAENAEPKLNRPYVKDPVLDPARAQLSATKSINSLEQEKTASDLQKLGQQHARTVDNQAIGERLRQKYWDARDAAKQVQDKVLGNLYGQARKQGITADMSDVRASVQKIVGADKNTFQDMPPLFSKILDEYPEGKAASVTREATTPTGAKKPIYRTQTTPAVPAKNTASFEELHSLYKQANKDWADATAAQNSTKAFHMENIKNQLKSKIDQFEGAEHGDFAQKFKQYNAGYSQYAKTFKNGAGAEIAKRGKYGEVRDAEDIVSKTILKSADKKKGVQDFLAIHGNDAEAHALLRDGILDNFSKATMRTGEFNPKAARNWLNQHKSAMDELPELRKHLENHQEAGQSLVERRAVLQKQARKIDQTYLAKVAGSQDADALITKALGSTTDGPKLMKGLLVGAKSPESKQAVARAIVDNISGRGLGLDFIAQHESTLKPVMDALGPEHWKNLKTIAEAEAVAGRVKAPTGVEMKKLEDLGTKYTGTSVKSLFASAKATASGRMSKGYAVIEGAGRYIYKVKSEEADRLLDEALFNPDIAGTLASMARTSAKPSQKQLLDLKRLSFNAGIVSTVEASGREAEDRRKHGQ